MSEELATIPDVNIDVEKERLKPRAVSFLFADYVAVTTSGKPDVCGIYDKIFIEEENTTSAVIAIFARLLEVTKGEFIITIFDPDNKIIAKAAGQLQNVGDKPYPRFVQFIERILLEKLKLGTYWFDLSFEGQSLAGVPLTVVLKNDKENTNVIITDVEPV